MILSSSIKNLLARFDLETAIDYMAKSGFDGIDFSYTDKANVEKYCGPQTDGEVFRDHFLRMRALAEEKGLRFVQAHAPVPSSYADPERHRPLFDRIVRAMRNGSYLGIPKIVVHPMQHLTYSDDGAPERLFEINMEFYKSLTPYCEEYNMQVCVENMWQYRGRKIVHSTCSRPEEFNRYLDGLDRRWFVGCLDIGHADLVCEDIGEFIESMGNTRLKSLHVHDVDGITDGHTLPFHATIDWEKVMRALAKIGYEGELNYEAEGFLANVPDQLYLSGLRYMADVGRYLIALYDRYKAEFDQRNIQ